MSDHPFTEDRAYARHSRRTGAVLVIGAGAVGSLLADELARLGISPLGIIDYDVLEDHNIARHRLGLPYIGQPKALALADCIRRDFPLCNVAGLNANFMDLPEPELLVLLSHFDLVVAATDELACQRRVNEICIKAEKTAVYPSVWATPETGTRDAEVGEILWVLAGAHTPCYACMTRWRPEGGTAEPRGGTRSEIQVLALAAVSVVTALLAPDDERARILDPERTLVLVHGFMQAVSDSVRVLFGDADESGLLHLRVPFPAEACPVCHGQAVSDRPPQRPRTVRTPPQPATRRPTQHSSLLGPIAALTCCVVLFALIWSGVSSRIDSQQRQKQQRATFAAEGAELERDALTAPFDCYVALNPSRATDREPENTERYPCDSIPLRSRDPGVTDSYLAVITVRGISYSTALKHNMDLNCASSGQLDISAPDSNDYYADYAPGSDLRVFISEQAGEADYVPKSENCQIRTEQGTHVLRTFPIDLKLNPSRRFDGSSTSNPSPTAQSPTQDQSSPAPVVIQPPSPGGTVPIDFNAACRWAYRGKASGQIEGSDRHIKCLDAQNQPLGGFSTPTGLTEWCQHLADTGQIPSNFRNADDPGPEKQWVCLQ